MKKYLSIIILLTCLSAKVYTQIPQLISYQGVLTDNSGNLVADGAYTLVFKLYTVATGGTAIWTESQNITTEQGIFNVNLGSVTPFTIEFSSQYYLGISIGGTEMSPRTQLTSAAYSMNGVPVGSIFNFGGISVPSGYLICDGSAVSRTTYSALFNAIGTAFGSGDGATTFNLPDLRGRFVRGVDGTAGNDPDNATRTAMNIGGNTGNNVGSVQTDELKSHNHRYNGTAPGAGATPPTSQVVTSDVAFWSVSKYVDSNGGNETRPLNAYLYFIIKY